MADPSPAGPRRLGIGASLAAGGQFALLLAATATSILIGRVVGPDGNGTFALAATVIYTATVVVGLGLTNGITFMVSTRAWAPADARSHAGRAALGLGLVGAVLVLFAYALTRHGLLQGLTIWMAVALAAIIPAVLWWSFAGAILLSEERYELYNSLALVQSLSCLVVAAVTVFSLDEAGVVAALVASQLLTAGWAVAALRRTTDGPRSTSRQPLTPAIRYGTRTWVSEMLSLVVYRFDLLILNAIAGTASVGVYSVALSLTAVGWVLPSALQTVLMPRAARVHHMAASGDAPDSEGDRVAAQAVRHGIVLTGPTAVILCLLLLLVPVLYGSDFSRSVTLGLILLPGVLALGLGKIMTSALLGSGHPEYPMYIAALVAPVTLVLYLVLIGQFEATGAAVASSLSYCASAAGTAYVYFRLSPVTLADVRPRRSDLGDYRALTVAAVARLRASRDA